LPAGCCLGSLIQTVVVVVVDIVVVVVVTPSLVRTVGIA
jgi:hypothetical protein